MPRQRLTGADIDARSVRTAGPSQKAFVRERSANLHGTGDGAVASIGYVLRGIVFFPLVLVRVAIKLFPLLV